MAKKKPATKPTAKPKAKKPTKAQKVDWLESKTNDLVSQRQPISRKRMQQVASRKRRWTMSRPSSTPS